MTNPNLDQLIATAALLRPMLGELVFVGGAVTSLLVPDEGAGLGWQSRSDRGARDPSGQATG